MSFRYSILVVIGLFSATASFAGDLKSVWYAFDQLRIDSMLAVDGGRVTKDFCQKHGGLDKIRATLTRLPNLTKDLSEQGKRRSLEALIAAGRGLTVEIEQYCYHRIGVDETVGALRELRATAMSGMGLSEGAVFSASASNPTVEQDDDLKYIECGVPWPGSEKRDVAKGRSPAN